jgi:hypothetical protein
MQKKTRNIIAMTVAFQTQDSCWFSWIMAKVQMKGINIFLTTFPESLHMNDTILKLTTDLEDALETRNITTWIVAFQTQDSCWCSWIMVQEQIKGIHLFYITLTESLHIIYTTWN